MKTEGQGRPEYTKNISGNTVKISQKNKEITFEKPKKERNAENLERN